MRAPALPGLSAEDALLLFRLAPLSTRRDIGMLAVIHRAVLGIGPPHFWRWFVPAPVRVRPASRLQISRHSKQLHDPCDGSQSSLLDRSVIGLIRVYNLLPQSIVDKGLLKDFQGALQALVKDELLTGRAGWEQCLSTQCGGIFQSRRSVLARPATLLRA